MATAAAGRIGARSRLSPAVVGAMACLGFSAVVAQIVLLRELLVVFGGNEMSLGVTLAAWLAWTAAGAALLGRRRPLHPAQTVASLQVALALVMPLTVVGVRASRVLFHPTPGELLGPGAMLITSVVTLAPWCLLSGWLFASAGRLCASASEAGVARATGTVYLLEAVGSAAGGLLASAVLLGRVGDFQIAVIVGFVNLLSAAMLGLRHRGGRAGGVLIAIGFTVALSWAGPRVEASSLGRLWPGFRLVASSNSIYGNLAVVEAEGGRTLYENGLVAFHAGDRPSAEEAVHFALLQHPAPASLLLIGGIGNGSLAEALKHHTLARIDAIELDPAVIATTRSYFPEAAAPMKDPRVHVYQADGRLFVKRSTSLYDVIAVNLPEPQTAQLNRFYTREFFAEAAQRLNRGGALSLGVRGAADYISPELAEFLGCLRRTLREVFPIVSVMPGETIHFSAARQTGVLPAGAEEMLARLRSRRVETLYVSEYFLPFRLSAERVRALEEGIRRAPDRVNRDFEPAAYYFGVTLWSAQFGSLLRDIFVRLARVPFGVVISAALLLALLGSAAVALSDASRRRRRAAGLCAGAMGMTAMALEVLLLLGFQALYGYVYSQLAILVAAFMAGMALGSGWALAASREPRVACAESQTPDPGRPAEHKTVARLAGLQFIAAAAPLMILLALLGLREMGTLAIAFPVMAMACGTLGGYQFQVASRVYFASGQASPGALYGIDLLGGCLAALLISTYLIPVHGIMKTAWLVAAVNLLPAVAVLAVVRTKR